MDRTTAQASDAPGRSSRALPDRPRSLVTGGAGFLGSHLCDRLIAEGHTVFCLDNLLTGRERNLLDLRDHPRFSFIGGDVTEPIRVDGPLDYVLHFASPASPKDYMRYPIHTLRAGAFGTHHFLELAKATGAVFLLASSSEVYGDPQVTPQPETYWGHVNPTGPRSVYDEAKRFAEALSVAYGGAHGIDVRIARIFNTYGPRMQVDDGRVMPAFITQALRGQLLTVYGDGQQTRSFCYVSDLVEGIYRLLTVERREGAPLIVNLGNPDEVTILRLAGEVIEAVGSGSAITFQPLPTDDPRVRCPDITRATELLQWTPAVSRQVGLRETIAYFADELKLSTV
jgi:dTDP-glucose 4,6-dehydratase